MKKEPQVEGVADLSQKECKGQKLRERCERVVSLECGRLEDVDHVQPCLRHNPARAVVLPQE
eukprot:scaffold1397_cov254-Pinguiococcus_pyrenoidosus.AAC.67